MFVYLEIANICDWGHFAHILVAKFDCHNYIIAIPIPKLSEISVEVPKRFPSQISVSNIISHGIFIHFD